SGASGSPKLVAHTPLSLNASVDSAVAMGLDDHEPIILLSTPLVMPAGFHALIRAIRCGATAVVLEHYDAEKALDAIEMHRCTWMTGLPCVHAELLRAQLRRPRNIASLRFCLSSGEPCPMQLQYDFEAVMGVPLRSVWDCTEAVGTLIHGLRA